MRRTALVLATCAGLSCAGPVVRDRVHEVDPPALARIAVAPFRAGPGLAEAPLDAATLVTRFVSEEFAASGFDVVPADDLVRAFEAGGLEVPYGDALALARVAAKEFGATALLSGQADRFRERQGGELGATRPASAGFGLELLSAPDGRKLWSARFDHTQRALTEDLFGAPRYPGGGTRWLSVAELVRWGARHAAERLVELR